jgi:hypothetical protein
MKGAERGRVLQPEHEIGFIWLLIALLLCALCCYCLLLLGLLTAVISLRSWL